GVDAGSELHAAIAAIERAPTPRTRARTGESAVKRSIVMPRAMSNVRARPCARRPRAHSGALFRAICAVHPSRVRGPIPCYPHVKPTVDRRTSGARNELSVSSRPMKVPSAMHPLREVALLFLRLGFTAFGGPAAHIALMEEEIVARRAWLGRD